MKKIAIHQPNYIPWVGFFYKIYHSDTFVFHDDIQFSKRGMHNFHYIKTDKGPLRLKIPVNFSHGDKINEVTIQNDLNWRERHLSLIKQHYTKAPYFNEVFADIEDMLSTTYTLLIDLNISIIKFICRKLHMQTEFVLASNFGITSRKEQKIIDLCNSLNADIYYSGTGAKAYQNDSTFIMANIKLEYSDYEPFEYEQQYTGFQSNVSIIDFLMNCGYNWDIVLNNLRS